MIEEKKDTEMKNIGGVEHKFSKEQLMSCEQFKERRDLLNALLDIKNLYTIKEIEEKIENYMKGKVK